MSPLTLGVYTPTVSIAVSIIFETVRPLVVQNASIPLYYRQAQAPALAQAQAQAQAPAAAQAHGVGTGIRSTGVYICVDVEEHTMPHRHLNTRISAQVSQYRYLSTGIYTAGTLIHSIIVIQTSNRN
eukprot:SAG22_NODE_12657_length_434_cov_1.065672_1_plen_126_part_01